MIQTSLIPVSTAILIFAITACTSAKKQNEQTVPSFTKVDSVTEKYLNLQDSVLTAWNAMIYDENCKIRSMQQLAAELKTTVVNNEDLNTLESRLDAASQISLKPEDINNPVFIEEYDFTINSLIQELVSITEANPNYTENPKLQRIVNEILQKDQRVDLNRAHYDEIAQHFNQFIENNKSWVLEIDFDSTVEKKPLFRIADSH